MKRKNVIRLVFLCLISLCLFACNLTNKVEYKVINEYNEAIEISKFDLSKIKLNINTGSSSYDMSLSKDMLLDGELNKLSTEGTHTINFEFKGNVYSFDISLIADPVIEKNTYEIINPYTTEVKLEEFNLFDIKLKISTSKSSYEVDVNETMISETDIALLSTTGQHNIIVKYDEFIGYFTVTLVKDEETPGPVNPPVKDIAYEIINPYTSSVEIGKFNLLNVKLRITSSSYSIDVDVTEDMLDANDISKLESIGVHTITVKYDGFVGTFEIELTEEINIYAGNTFDLNGYYTAAIGKGGNELKLILRSIISKTTKTETYDALRQDLQVTDSAGNGYIYDFYTHKTMTAKWDSGATWNREHVWPRSKAWYQYEGAGADIHCVKPVDSGDNSSRGNKAFGIGSAYFEPNDISKGDVARTIFYMLTRYSQTDSDYPVTNVAQSLQLLLQWNKQDPVDDLERQRNNEAYKIQGNRNPFIDYSDYAYYIWDLTMLTVSAYINENIYSFSYLQYTLNVRNCILA